MTILRIGIGCRVAVVALLVLTTASAQRQMEKLGRGVVAVNQGEGKAFVSWRLLGTEPDSIAFNVYRAVGAAKPVKLNARPLTTATCYQDSGVDFTQHAETAYAEGVYGHQQARRPLFGDRDALRRPDDDD